ncbi:MAG: YihA family ribosome biogenesis GTP-binding protein [Gammaproteobacteria bacterium]|nr:YihA family ribosome biogenesis GTP-binding protein [Gammaproteobacteria bacterium]MBI5619079.1 YihA family ribosome biogenesis GTP-binding protein [Gammaproteobacteria bacterium]
MIEDHPEKLLFNAARFALSVPTLAGLPPDDGLEIAFAGRSNVGKSSTLNALCNHRGLARTSATPGRTQHFVVFDLDAGRRLIDLPGFGYARVAKSVREHWHGEIPRYLERRRSLVGLVLITDCRHALKDAEVELLRWCRDADLPVLLVLNKSDKLSRNEGANAVHAARRVLNEMGAAGLVTPQLFSATQKIGVPEALAVLGDWLAVEE